MKPYSSGIPHFQQKKEGILHVCGEWKAQVACRSLLAAQLCRLGQRQKNCKKEVTPVRLEPKNRGDTVHELAQVLSQCAMHTVMNAQYT